MKDACRHITEGPITVYFNAWSSIQLWPINLLQASPMSSKNENSLTDKQRACEIFFGILILKMPAKSANNKHEASMLRNFMTLQFCRWNIVLSAINCTKFKLLCLLPSICCLFNYIVFSLNHCVYALWKIKDETSQIDGFFINSEYQVAIFPLF